MIARCLLLCAVAVPLFGQFSFYSVNGTAEQLISAPYSLGSAAAGDLLQQQIRLKNTGTADAPVTLISISGDGFVLKNVPNLPKTISPGQYVEFTATFQSTGLGSYSANLKADHLSAILQASVVPDVSVFVEAGAGRQALTTGATVDYGNIQRGSTASRGFTLSNQTKQPLIPVVALVGTGFSLDTTALAKQLAPGDSSTFTVTCAPVAAGVLSATLQIDQRQINLQATGIEPPLPHPAIQITLPDPASGEQGSLTVSLDSASQASGTGKLTVDFRPSASGANDDPAIIFPVTGNRSAQVTVAQGDTAGHFGTLSSLEFQTGTTAGTLLFTLQLGNYTAQASVAVAPAAAHMDTVTATRTSNGLSVQVSGFDNTRTAGALSFTFYDKNGTAIAPGKIQVDGSSAFQQYFASSTVGGLFNLRAVFPVTGSATAIDSAEIAIANSTGSATSGRIQIN